ncbi:MAG: hypothetical protein OEY74_12215 [Gammaproteobacteria bacterium]|nr:hypothetical protein [Gammaproteobacteria bacterium]
MKGKEKKKGKKKNADKKTGKGKGNAPKGAKSRKLKKLTKALRKEIRQLTRELQERDRRLNELSGSRDATATKNAIEASPQGLHDSSGIESVSERKETWERHQYLRLRYEIHLEAGLTKAAARHNADQDLRQRYGDTAGYTTEQLDSILS